MYNNELLIENSSKQYRNNSPSKMYMEHMELDPKRRLFIS